MYPSNSLTASRYRLRIVALLLTFVLVTSHTVAQNSDETEYRMEVGAALGAGTALSDANSKLFGAMGVAGGGVLRFLLNPRMAVKLSASYIKLAGDVANVSNFYPANLQTAGTEQLQFSVDGGLTDVSATYELNFLPYGYVQGYQGYYRFTPYIQAGFGLTYSDAGSAFTVSFPVGLGFKWKVKSRLNLGLDWRVHFTLSDKLEGLEAPLGIKTTGFKNKDHYTMVLLSLTYDISPRCPNCNKD